MGLTRSFFAIAAIALASFAQAHEGARTGPNGGEVRDAGKYHLELTVKDTLLPWISPPMRRAGTSSSCWIRIARS